MFFRLWYCFLVGCCEIVEYCLVCIFCCIIEIVCGMFDFGFIDIFWDCNEVFLIDRVLIWFIVGVFLENVGYNLFNFFILFILFFGSEDFGGVVFVCKWLDDLWWIYWELFGGLLNYFFCLKFGVFFGDLFCGLFLRWVL